MSNPNPLASCAEVPTQVFESFLKALEAEKSPPLVVERLRGLLLSDKTLSEKAVMDALFSEDPLP